MWNTPFKQGFLWLGRPRAFFTFTTLVCFDVSKTTSLLRVGHQWKLRALMQGTFYLFAFDRCAPYCHWGSRPHLFTGTKGRLQSSTTVPFSMATLNLSYFEFLTAFSAALCDSCLAKASTWDYIPKQKQIETTSLGEQGKQGDQPWKLRTALSWYFDRNTSGTLFRSRIFIFFINTYISTFKRSIQVSIHLTIFHESVSAPCTL